MQDFVHQFPYIAWGRPDPSNRRCCALAERAFGRTHGATIALRAPLGDATRIRRGKPGRQVVLDGRSVRGGRP